jgi:hypothetical protein
VVDSLLALARWGGHALIRIYCEVCWESAASVTVRGLPICHSCRMVAVHWFRDSDDFDFNHPWIDAFLGMEPAPQRVKDGHRRDFLRFRKRMTPWA